MKRIPKRKVVRVQALILSIIRDSRTAKVREVEIFDGKGGSVVYKVKK